MKKRQKQGADSNEERSDLRRALNRAEDKLGTAPEPERVANQRPLQPGDRVELLRLGTRAEVVSVAKDGTVQLRAGILNVTAKSDEVKLLSAAPAPKKQRGPRPGASQHQVTRSGASREIDLRGMMSDEAVAVLSQFLDSAVMAHLAGVSVIHGKGTGALRAAVHQYLKTCKYVKRYRLGRYGEGEDGVTIVELK